MTYDDKIKFYFFDKFKRKKLFTKLTVKYKSYITNFICIINIFASSHTHLAHTHNRINDWVCMY